MYFVVECSTMSAPSVSGCCSAGEAKVLSTNTFAPAAGAISDDRGDVGDRQQRVGRRLDPDQPGAAGDRRAHRVEVGQRHRRVLDTPLPEHLVDQPEGAAVGVVGDDDVVAGAQHRAQRAVGGGHAGAERPAEACRPRPRPAPSPAPTRVGLPVRAYSKPAAQTADAVLGEGAAGVDRGVDGAGGGVGPVARRGWPWSRIPAPDVISHRFRSRRPPGCSLIDIEPNGRRKGAHPRSERLSPPDLRSAGRPSS